MFSELLDDVTYIPNPIDKNLKIRQNSGLDQPPKVDRQVLAQAIYPSSKQSDQVLPSSSASYEIVDAVSRTITSGSDPNVKGPYDIKNTSMLSDFNIKSAVSESPVLSLASQNNSSIKSPILSHPSKEVPEKTQLKIQFELEKSMVDMKYKQQIEALERKNKGSNPLTKRLMTKIQSEWTKAVEKKKHEFLEKSGGQLNPFEL